MTNEIDTIMEQFNDFVDGVRMIMITQRSKEGGKMNNPDKVSKRKISSNRIEFEAILKEFLEIKNLFPEKQLRIYGSVNERNFEKGIREFKRRQLEADYYDHESKCNFYLDIKNRFLGSIMKPGARVETKFLIDIDDIPSYWTNELYIKSIEEHLKKIGAEIIKKYQTKNGVHIITKPFNPSLFNGKFGEIKKDALLLLSY